jgi:hypothetical protein
LLILPAFTGAVFSVTSSVPGWSYGETEAKPLVHSNGVGADEQLDQLLAGDYGAAAEHNGEVSEVPTWFAVVKVGGKQFKVSAAVMK